MRYCFNCLSILQCTSVVIDWNFAIMLTAVEISGQVRVGKYISAPSTERNVIPYSLLMFFWLSLTICLQKKWHIRSGFYVAFEFVILAICMTVRMYTACEKNIFHLFETRSWHPKSWLSSTDQWWIITGGVCLPRYRFDFCHPLLRCRVRKVESQSYRMIIVRRDSRPQLWKSIIKIIKR